MALAGRRFEPHVLSFHFQLSISKLAMVASIGASLRLLSLILNEAQEDFSYPRVSTERIAHEEGFGFDAL